MHHLRTKVHPSPTRSGAHSRHDKLWWWPGCDAGSVRPPIAVRPFTVERWPQLGQAVRHLETPGPPESAEPQTFQPDRPIHHDEPRLRRSVPRSATRPNRPGLLNSSSVSQAESCYPLVTGFVDTPEARDRGEDGRHARRWTLSRGSPAVVQAGPTLSPRIPGSESFVPWAPAHI